MNKKTKYTCLATGIIVAVFILTLTATDAMAVQLEATHSVVSSVNDDYGLNTITLEVTVSNTAGGHLSAINLMLMPDRTMIVIDSPTLIIDSLNADETATVNWTVNSPMPAELWESGLLMLFAGEAVDSSGQAIPVSFTSRVKEK